MDAPDAPEAPGSPGPDLQFDAATPRDAGAPAAVSMVCTACQTTMAGEYFDVNGQPVCRGCSEVIARHADTPRGAGALLRAAAFGAVAAVLGAVLYFAVVEISGFEIGLVAIAIGYMVGYGVRLGTRGRGGRRFQALALVLTYVALALAYSSVVVKSVIDKRDGDRAAVAAHTAAGAAAPEAPAAAADAAPSESDGGGSPAIWITLGLLGTLAFVLSLPVIMVASTLPGGLISGVIIFFGMMQAWRMTAAPRIQVLGPFRIGPTPEAGR